jgi:HSP20 family protein
MVDIYQSKDGWLIKFDLAGVRPEDITFSLEGSRLSVSGIRRDMFLGEGYHCYSMEISYSRFARTIILTGDVKPASVTTEYSNGMFVVKVTN